MDANIGKLILRNVEEHEFKIGDKANLEQLKGKPIKMGILSILKYKEGIENVQLTMGIRVDIDNDTPVFTYAVSFDISINGWNEMSHKEADIKMNLSVCRMLKYCYGYIGGLLLKHTTQSGLPHFYLPIFDVKDLLPALVIKNVD